MIKSISQLLFYSNNLDKTFEFYKKLGFDVAKDKEKDVVNFYVNWFQVIFVAKKHSESKNSGAFTYIKVDDVDEYYKEIVKKGIEADKPENMEWGNRELVVVDPDGYSLVFFNKTK